MDQKKMVVFVTGGAGFIGSHITRALVNLGELDVHVLDNLSTGQRKNVPKGAHLHAADLRDHQTVEILFARYKPEVIFHEAAQISVINSVADPVNDAQNNIIGLLTMMESARRHGLKKIIAASSGGVVYGDPVHDGPQRESDPLKPASPYGVAKLALENYLRYYWEVYHLPYIVLRYANVYGPRQNPKSGAGVIAWFMKAILTGQQPIINGNGAKTRDYIYISDVVAANLAAFNYDGIGPFNVGTGVETSVTSVFRLVRDIVGIDVPEVHGADKPGEQLRSVLDVTRARELLGWTPTVEFKVGLRDTIAWYIEEAKATGGLVIDKLPDALGASIQKS